jgi:hypothetical protein
MDRREMLQHRPHASLPDTAPAGALLRQTLLASGNAGGGWGYYAGKASRLEPTCWALLALAESGSSPASLAPHAAFLTRCQQASGWLVEDPTWPVNIGFNALAAFAWVARPELATDDERRQLMSALVSSKGAQAPQSAEVGQDSSLQGWPWIDAMFSWVEPTSWGLLALKKARQMGVTDAAAQARVAEAERLLVDRCCRSGGWNFGNASVMHQDLRPYVPTTALALLAMQDRRDVPAVMRSLTYLEARWSDEVSATTLSLTLLCLAAYGRPVVDVEARLSAHTAQALSFGNVHGVAMMLFALSQKGPAGAFRI